MIILFINKNQLLRYLRILRRIVTIVILLIILIFIIYNAILTICFEKIANSLNSDYQNPVICDDLQVHFVDVGQGDGTVIINKDKVIVIDTGPMIHKFKMKNYLKSLGVKRINALIITHPHQDHFGGLDAILCNFKVDKIYTTEINSKVDKSLAESYHLYQYNYITSKYNILYNYERLLVVKPNRLKQLKIGDLSFSFIGPDKTYENFNNNSIVTRLDYKNISMLFPGDIESEAEKDLVQNHSEEIQVDVLKIAHHGSKTSSIQEFLDVANPSIAIISCEYQNTLWHPHAAVAKRLETMGISLYRTDEQGTIILSSDGTTITANTEEADYQSGKSLSSK